MVRRSFTVARESINAVPAVDRYSGDCNRRRRNVLMRTEELTDFGLGLRIHDLDRNRSGALDSTNELRRLVYEHAAVLISDAFTGMDNDSYAEFASRFGAPCPVLAARRRADGHPCVERLTVVPSKNNTGWHQDLVEVPGQSPITFMLCDEAPTENGETLIADMRAMIDGLPAVLRTELEGYTGYYPLLDSIEQDMRLAGALESKGWSADEFAKRMAHVRNYTMPLVNRHPITGRKTLSFNEWHRPHITELVKADGDQLLDTILAAATSETNVYRHRWRVGDLLIWDNSLTMHTAVRVGAGTKVHRRIIVNGPFQMVVPQ
jgi:taurine dioxygenase